VSRSLSYVVRSPRVGAPGFGPRSSSTPCFGESNVRGSARGLRRRHPVLRGNSAHTVRSSVSTHESDDRPALSNGPPSSVEQGAVARNAVHMGATQLLLLPPHTGRTACISWSPLRILRRVGSLRARLPLGFALMWAAVVAYTDSALPRCSSDTTSASSVTGSSPWVGDPGTPTSRCQRQPTAAIAGSRALRRMAPHPDRTTMNALANHPSDTRRLTPRKKKKSKEAACGWLERLFLKGSPRTSRLCELARPASNAPANHR